MFCFSVRDIPEQRLRVPSNPLGPPAATRWGHPRPPHIAELSEYPRNQIAADTQPGEPEGVERQAPSRETVCSVYQVQTAVGHRPTVSHGSGGKTPPGVIFGATCLHTKGGSITDNENGWRSNDVVEIPPPHLDASVSHFRFCNPPHFCREKKKRSDFQRGTCYLVCLYTRVYG